MEDIPSIPPRTFLAWFLLQTKNEQTFVIPVLVTRRQLYSLALSERFQDTVRMRVRNELSRDERMLSVLSEEVALKLIFNKEPGPMSVEVTGSSETTVEFLILDLTGMDFPFPPLEMTEH